MKSSCLLLTCYLFFNPLAWTSADTPKSRPDSHAPIGVMGDHGHKPREVMLSYRFMAMDMQRLQSGTTTVETAEVLKDFMMAPTVMQMQMHGFGTMFAPHDKLTFMAMANYQFLRWWSIARRVSTPYQFTRIPTRHCAIGDYVGRAAT